MLTRSSAEGAAAAAAAVVASAASAASEAARVVDRRRRAGRYTREGNGVRANRGKLTFLTLRRAACGRALSRGGVVRLSEWSRNALRETHTPLTATCVGASWRTRRVKIHKKENPNSQNIRWGKLTMPLQRHSMRHIRAHARSRPPDEAKSRAYSLSAPDSAVRTAASASPTGFGRPRIAPSAEVSTKQVKRHSLVITIVGLKNVFGILE